MIAVLSPAKNLDFTTPVTTGSPTAPRLAERADELAAIMAGKSSEQIGAMMKLSPKLAQLNADRYTHWQEAADQARPAVLAFAGDTYRGLDAPATFTPRDHTRAQKTLRILSGLYGLLRPLDAIRPYRLEMGTDLATPRGEDLYDYWGDTLTQMLRDDVDASPGADVLVNLASKEYFRAVDPEALERRVISPVFLDAKGDGPPKIVSFHAKKARGAMAGWMVRERVDRPAQLTQFDGLGYQHDPDASTDDAPVFVRRNPA